MSIKMSNKKILDKRLEHNDTCKENTTYESDYKNYNLEIRRIYKWQKDKCDVTKPATPLKHQTQETDQESLMLKKPNSHIPFNLHWKPKPIIGTHPKKNFLTNRENIETRHLNIIEKDRLQAMKSRPRINMAPAVKMDDIADKSVRDLIISNIYESDWKKATRLAAASYFKGKRTHPICTADERPNLQVAYNPSVAINVKFRRRAKHWDNTQNRMTVDTTAQFWLNKELKEEDIFATEKLVTQEVKDEIKQLIRDDKLRLQYDLPNPNYAGFIATVPYGVKLGKLELHDCDPNISISQAISTKFTDYPSFRNGRSS